MNNPLRIIRWKFVVPVSILVAGIAVFFVVFFDPLLARAIESVGSKVNGAKVEVNGLKTKFFKGTMGIQRVQVANKDLPMQNIVELGPMDFQIKPFELIKKRVIIPDASLHGIQFNTARKTSGALPRRVTKEDEKQSAAAKLAAKYQDRFMVNLEGMKGDARKKIEFDPKDTEIVKQSDALKEKAEGLPDELDSRVKNLNVEERLKKVEQDLQGLKNTPTKGPEAITAIPAALKKLKESRAELSQIKADVQSAKSDSMGDLKELKNGITGLNLAKARDLEDLMSRLNLDFADPDRLIEGLIGPAVMERFQTALHYVQVARAHMPSAKERASLPPKPRAQGMDISFPSPAAPPKFWLMKAGLDGIYEGVQASGYVSHFTSDPSRVGKPARVDLSGQRGEQAITLNAILDHVTDVSRDSVNVKVTGLSAKEIFTKGPMAEAVIGGGGSAELLLSVIGDGKLGGQLELALAGLKLDSSSLLKQVGVEENPSSKEDRLKASFMKDVASAIENTPKVAVTAQIFGTWNDPGFKISSNLGPVLAATIKKSVGNAVADQKRELEAKLDSVLKGRKAELDAKSNALQEQVNGKLGGLEAKVQQKINEAAGINLGGGGEGENSPVPGLKIPKLDKLFKK